MNGINSRGQTGGLEKKSPRAKRIKRMLTKKLLDQSEAESLV